jgi:HNH endonuclease
MSKALSSGTKIGLQAPACANVVALDAFKRPLPKTTDLAQPQATAKLIATRAKRLAAKVYVSGAPDACWPFTGSINIANSYGQLKDVSPKTGKPTMRSAHVIAWELANGRPVPQGLHVLHAEGCVKSCCRPDHLRIGTRRENMADAIKENRGPGRKKLNASQVQEIVAYRRDYRLTNEMLACMHGVTATAIAQIFAGRTHTRVTGPTTVISLKGFLRVPTVTLYPWLPTSSAKRPSAWAMDGTNNTNRAITARNMAHPSQPPARL